MTAENNSIIKLNPEDFGLTETKAREVSAMFNPMLAKMVELEDEYNSLVSSITREPTPDDCKAAKELRLKYVKVRTGTEKIHKELKAFYLAGGRFIDGWKNTQKAASEGIEKRLSEIETYHDRKEAERKAELERSRKEELSLYSDQIPGGLGDMSEDVWAIFLSGAKKAHEDRLEAERKAEEERQRQEVERIEREKAEAAERERIRKENERLKAEAEERAMKEVEERCKREAEEQARRKAEALAEKKRQEERERVEREHQAKLEAERRERERIAAELAAKEKAEREAKEKAEHEAGQRAEAELKKGDAELALDLYTKVFETLNDFPTSRIKSRTAKAAINIAFSQIKQGLKTLETEFKK